MQQNHLILTAEIMETITLNISNPTIIPSLKKVLRSIEGVAIVPQRRKTMVTDVPNATTVKAINDVKAGRTYRASSVDDLLNQCLD